MPFTNPHLRFEAARLAPFLAFSALLHAMVIGSVPLLDRPAAEPTGALHLALARPPTPPANVAAAERSPTPQRAAKAAKPSPPAAAPVAPREPSPAPVEPAAPAAAAALVANEPPAQPADEASVRVIAQVRSALARYFTYPFIARRQGWQGEVLLGFSVTPEGRIDQVEVVRSSGHRLLDEAARDSLARVGSLPDYVAPDGARLHLQLPIIYRLAEG